jgi:hypothetical protein
MEAMSTANITVDYAVDMSGFVDVIRNLLILDGDPEQVRLYDLFQLHCRECSVCYMSESRIPLQWSRRWVSRTYRVATERTCGYGRYLRMASLRAATK